MAAKKKLGIKKKFVSRLKRVIKYIGYKWVLPLVYKWHCRKPINDKLVVFADHRVTSMPDNFQGIFKKCIEEGFQCEILIGLSSLRHKREKLSFYFQFMKLFAQCKVLFLDDWFPLVDLVKPRQGTQVVQLWHACGVMKKWGYACSGKAWGKSKREQRVYPDYVNQTLATVSSFSEGVLEGYRAAFNCGKDVVKPLGVPRTDIYFDNGFQEKARQKVRSLFPEIGERKIILYAPTFRGRTIAGSYIKYDLDFKKLKDALSDRYALITKFHPLMAKDGLLEAGRLQGYGFVFDGSKVMTAEEALCVADVLITDYSSIMFEYLLLERPIISYIFDIDTYIKDRGLFFPYDQLAPGPYVFTQEELTERLLTVEEWFDIDRIRLLKDEFMSACDGHSTQRIYDYVFHQPSERERIQL